MKVSDITALDIVVDITRHNVTSLVTVRFKRNDITIKASMRCPRQLKEEANTQKKILSYLGFTDLQIQSLRHD